MALRDYLTGAGYVVFVTFLGLFLAPDPTGLVPLGALLAGGLVATHAVVRVARPARVLLVSAGATFGLTILATVGFATVGAILPASALLGTLTVVGTGPVGYALVLAGDVADRGSGETAGDDSDDAADTET